MVDGPGAHGRHEIATIGGRSGDCTRISVEVIDGERIITAHRDDGADPLELTPTAAAEVIRALATAITCALGKS